MQALGSLLVEGSVVTASDRGTHLEISVVPAAEGAATGDLVAAAGGQLSRTDGGVLVRLPKRPLAGT